jgi:sugar-specific transcriptional regulator TrmB
MEIKQLCELGLTENQARVYVELLKNPAQNPSSISKELSIDRSFIYSILESLITKGLVSYSIESNKKIFYASNPECLLKDLEEKRLKTIRVIEDLKKIKKEDSKDELAKIYEGKSGFKEYIRQFLDSKSFLTLGGGANTEFLDLLRFEYPHYLAELNKKKIKGKLITSQENKKIMSKIYKESDIKIKTLKSLNTDVNFTIFDNKLAIWSVKEKPFIIIINRKSVSQSLGKYFKELWDRV